MKKGLVLLFLLCPLFAMAQSLSSVDMQSENGSGQPNKFKMMPTKHVEGDVFIGFTRPLGGYHGMKSEFGGALGGELRYNLSELPFDFGLQASFTNAVYSETIFRKYYCDEGELVTEAYDAEQSNRTFCFAVVADWNFRQGYKVNPFVGAGLGWTAHSIVHDEVYSDGDEESKPIFISRVGVELLSHFRFTLSTNITGQGFNNAQLSIGVTFGGGKK